MELLRQELAERPTVERALRSLGEAVGLSRSTIRRRLRSAAVTTAEKDIQRRAQIHSIALEMRSYGYRPITKELRRRGVIINSKVVLRLLREDNLLCLRRRAFVATTDSATPVHSLPEPGPGTGVALISTNSGSLTLLTFDYRAHSSIWLLSWTLIVVVALAGHWPVPLMRACLWRP